MTNKDSLCILSYSLYIVYLMSLSILAMRSRTIHYSGRQMSKWLHHQEWGYLHALLRSSMRVSSNKSFFAVLLSEIYSMNVWRRICLFRVFHNVLDRKRRITGSTSLASTPTQYPAPWNLASQYPAISLPIDFSTWTSKQLHHSLRYSH